MQIVTKPPFAVLGKEGHGPAQQGPTWIMPLWDKAWKGLQEIQHLVNGPAWGLKSAVDEPFGHWQDQGKYLAGWEVDPDTETPDGWTRWDVPETTFAVVGCTIRTYRDAWDYVENEFLQLKGYEAAGAFHECYPPEFENPETDTFYLYFTIRKTD